MSRAVSILLALVLASGPLQAQVAQANNRLGPGHQMALRSAGRLLDLPARLVVTDTPLAAGLAELSERSGVPLAFSPGLLPTTPRVNCACREVSVREALDRMLEGTPYRYSALRHQVLIERQQSPTKLQSAVVFASTGTTFVEPVAMPLPPVGQTGTITGRVVEASSERPLRGAQVFVVGTSIGTITQPDGQYTLRNVPAGDITIRAVLIGYVTDNRTASLSDGATLRVDFQLREEALALDEIVVTGTAGQARRREVGNSISQIDAGDLAEPVMNTDALLQGRVAGMSVTEGSGMAGSGSQIRLRGNVSASLSNQPLVYIDGVRVRSDGYPANAPIGAGSAGANVNASPLNDLNPADIERVEVLKGAAATTLYGTEAAAGVIQIITRRGTSGAPVWSAKIDQGFSEMRPYGTEGNPFLWMDPWLERGWRQNYNLSVSGGGEDLRYFVSGGHTNNKHVLPNDREEKQSVRGNFSFKPASNLAIEWNTSVTSQDISNTPAGNNSSGLPLNVYRQDKNYFGAFDEELINQTLDFKINTGITRLITGATLTLTPSAGFVNRLTVGYDRADVEGRNVRPFGFFSAPQGMIGNKQWTGTTLTTDYAGTLSSRLTSDLRSSLSWGMQAITVDEITVDARSENFPGPGVPTVSSGALFRAGEQRFRIITGGAFLQSLLDFRDRYFLTLGVRVDGNSAFGEQFGLQTYPKISGAYVISDEPFWPDQFGSLKLRGAYGHAGRAPGAFDAARTWTPVGWGVQPAFRPANVGNPNLGPERTAETEVGFDAVLFDGNLAADFTYYHQKTRDALFAVMQTPSEGFIGSQLENVGEIENRGVEVALDATIVQRPSFGWNVGLHLATNRSKLLSLGGAAPFQDASFGSGWYYEGQPVPVITSRFIRNPDAIEDPDIVENHHFGPNHPTRTIGLTSSVRLPYGVVLSGRAEYMGGHYMADNLSTGAYRRGIEWPLCDNARGLLGQDRPQELSAWERAWCIQGNVTGSDIYPADFAKLRDLTLQVPVSFAVPGATAATLSFSARNWFVWRNSDFLVMDPESNNNVGMFANVKSITEHIPPTATVTASLQITF